MIDVLGEAISDFYHQRLKGKLWIHNTYGRKEEMPVETYFRKEKDMPDLELVAMQLCKGKVLDIGAGAGSISLALQKGKRDVTALEISPKAAAIMKLRGVKNIIIQDVFSLKEHRFDTLLLLMNGIGLTGTVDNLHLFLQHAKTLLTPAGQLLFDSSDIAYLYKGKKRPADRYYGEISYQYEYNKQRTDWFSWLYIDQQLLKTIATREGWLCEIIFEDEYDQYLARLTATT